MTNEQLAKSKKQFIYHDTSLDVHEQYKIGD